MLLFFISLFASDGAGARPLASPVMTAPKTVNAPVGAVGTRFASPIDFSDGVKSTDTTRIFEILTSRSDLASIAVRYSNFASTPIETNAKCDLTITSAIEFNPSVPLGVGFPTTDAATRRIPFTFKGRRKITLGLSSPVVTSDPIYHRFRAGQGVYIRTWRKGAKAGCKMPVGHYINQILFEATNDGYFQGFPCVMQGTTPALEWTCRLAPIAGVVLPIVPGSTKLIFSSADIHSNRDDGKGIYKSDRSMTRGSIDYIKGIISLRFSVPTNASLLLVEGYGRDGADAPDETLTAKTTDTNSVKYRYVYEPAALLGTYVSSSPAKPYTFCVFGDSIDWGAGNAPDYGVSWINYSINGKAGILNVATPRDRASYFSAITSHLRLDSLAGLCDRAIANYGTNDINGGTLVKAEENIVKSARAISRILPNGYLDLYWVNVLPRTASAKSEAPLSPKFGPDVATSSSPTMRNALNTWELSQINLIYAGILNINSLMEGKSEIVAGAGNGKWKSLIYTTDGTHPSLAGNLMVGNSWKERGTSPQPEFVIPYSR